MGDRFTGFAASVAVCAGLGLGAQAEAAADCDPVEQLACSCKAAGLDRVNATVHACFKGDVNTVTANQADSFSAEIFAAINWPVKLDAEGRAVNGVPD